MLRHIGEQVSRFSAGIVGATLGVTFSMSTPTSFAGTVVFLVVFFILYLGHGLPVYFFKTPNGRTWAWMAFFFYTVLLLFAAGFFCHLGFLDDAWSVKQVDFRLLLVFITLFIVSFLTIMSATFETTT